VSRSVRYHCLTDGPFLVSCQVSKGNVAPTTARCPICRTYQWRTHRRKPGGKSISVPGETFERLKAEAARRGVPIRRLVEEYTRDVK
jgi:LDH2 family malate/lactate/ureidoglycolate dehydrogenase